MKNSTFRFGTINVGTYNNKEDEILDMMKERKLDILGMAETRHGGKSVGQDLGDGYVLIYRGVDVGIRKHGVAMIVGPRLAPFIQKVQLVSERLMTCTIRIKNKNYNVHQIYAPQQGHTQEEKDNFMELLDLHLEGQAGNTNLLLGDFNARVGSERRGIENVIGPFGEETRNVEGENLIDFCMRNNLKIMNGFFKHQDSHRFTRYRWNQITDQFDQKSIIDYVVTSDKRLVQNVKVFPGVSLDSDHRLVLGKINIPSVRTQKAEKRKIIKTEILKDPDVKARFQNKFTEKLQELQQRDWIGLKEKALEVGEQELGYRYVGGTKKRRTVWWNEEVKGAVKMKNKKHRRWMKERNQQTREEYVHSRNEAEEVKRNSRINSWIELGGELMEDLKKNKKKIFAVAKSYRKDKSKQYNIKDDQGNVIGTASELNEKWTQYFRSLLNVTLEGNTEEEYIFQFDRDNREDVITYQEFEDALKEMKNGKSPGYDNIPIELFKEGGDLAKQILFDLILSFWLESRVTEDWG